jgi:hypothetical protein
MRQMSVTFMLAGAVVVLAGCGGGNEAAKESAPDTNAAAAPSAGTRGITLHVKDMIGRQAIT